MIFGHQVFADSYFLRLHKQKMYNGLRVIETKNVGVTHLVRQIDDESLQEERYMFKRVFVESETDNGGHSVFNFALDTQDAHILSQRLDTVFEKLKCAAKWNVAIGFVVKNIEAETSR